MKWQRVVTFALNHFSKTTHVIQQPLKKNVQEGLSSLASTLRPNYSLSTLNEARIWQNGTQYRLFGTEILETTRSSRGPYRSQCAFLPSNLNWQKQITGGPGATPWNGVLLSGAETASTSLATAGSTPPTSLKVGPGIGRAILPRIKQSPKKVNLVAAMVRGMRVEDALTQMAVSTKRAAKTVAKLVQMAAANGVHNHGLNGSKLIVAEAFVGKDKFLSRNFPHAKGRSGVRQRPRSILTVIVKEMDVKQERKFAKAQTPVHWQRRDKKMMPHRIIEVGRRRPQEGEGREAEGDGKA